MNDGGFRRSSAFNTTRAEQKRTNWFIAALCIAAFIVFVSIFAPLMTLRETDDQRQRAIQAAEYTVADNWTNIFRTRLMDGTYAGGVMEGVVLSGDPTLPNLSSPPEERTKGQFVPKFDSTATYLFDALPAISHLYLAPGGVVNQCYPVVCVSPPRDMLNMDDPSNRYTPTGPAVAESGVIGYVGPIRNNITTTFNMEWVVQVRLPIYTSAVSEFSIETFWGFSLTTVNITGIILDQKLRESMEHHNMDYLLYRIGSTSGYVHVIACFFPGCESDGRGGDEEDALIPSQDDLFAFMETGSGPVLVMLGANFTIVVRSRKTATYTTPSVVVTCIMCGVGAALLWLVVSALLIVCCVAEEGGLVTPAPKRAPFAIVTIGPSRARVLWRNAPEIMPQVAEKLMHNVQQAAKKNHAYPVPRVHPYTHSYATRSVADAVQLAFSIISWAEREGIDRELIHKLGAERGRLCIACAVHWCTDATVRLTSLSDPYPFCYEGRDVAHAGHAWVVAAPNTVTLTQSALDHLEQREPARHRRQLYVIPYIQARPLTAATTAITARSSTAMTSAVASPPLVSLACNDLNAPVNEDGPPRVPFSRGSSPWGSGGSGYMAGAHADEQPAEFVKVSPLYLVTDLQQPRLRRAIEVARAHYEAPTMRGVSAHTDQFEYWDNILPVSAASSEAGGGGGATIGGQSSRASMMVGEGFGGVVGPMSLESSTRGVESTVSSPWSLRDGGIGYSPNGADFSGASLSVLVPSTASASDLANGASGGGPLSSSFGAPASSVVTPLTRAIGRFGRASSRSTGVVINVSQGANAALEGREDPLGLASGLGAAVDRHGEEGTPLTDLHWRHNALHSAAGSTTTMSSASIGEDVEEKVGASTSARGMPTGGERSTSGSTKRLMIAAPASHRSRTTAVPMAFSHSTSFGLAPADGRSHSGESGDEGDGRRDVIAGLFAYEARYAREKQMTRVLSSPSGHGSTSSHDDVLHAYAERQTGTYHSGNQAPFGSSNQHSSRPPRISDDGDALTQLLLHPPIPKYLDDSLRSSFQYQAVGVPLPYNAVQVLIFYMYNGYKLLFRPLAAVEQANIFQRFVIAFGVPATNTLDHLAAWAAIRYVEQHQETRQLCEALFRHTPQAARARVDRNEASSKSETSSVSVHSASEHRSSSSRSDKT